MNILSTTDLLPGYHQAVLPEALSFTVQEKEYWCILGENGAGKSTLLKTLLGLQRPLSGKVTLNTKGIDYLPQQTPIQMDFPASVKEVVLSGCQARQKGFAYRKEEKDRADAAIQKLGLNDLQKRCFRELSGGQQQRVLLARALCAADRLLLVDEPVAGLDPKVSEELYELLNSLHQEGMTILMVTHDLNALKYCDHVLQLGQEIFAGKKEDYLHSTAGQRYTEAHV